MDGKVKAGHGSRLLPAEPGCGALVNYRPVHPELRNLCIPSLLDAVISESLHVHPPVESIGNLSITEIPLPDGTIVQPGEEVLISAWTSSDNSSHASCSTGGHHLNCEEGSADRTTNEGLD